MNRSLSQAPSRAVIQGFAQHLAGKLRVVLIGTPWQSTGMIKAAPGWKVTGRQMFYSQVEGPSDIVVLERP